MVELLRLEKINKFFGYRRVLSTVSMTVHAGECHVLLGDSNASRTTLLDIVAGTTSLDSGKVYWRDKNITAAMATNNRQAKATSKTASKTASTILPTPMAIKNTLQSFSNNIGNGVAGLMPFVKKTFGKSVKTDKDGQKEMKHDQKEMNHGDTIASQIAVLDNSFGLLPHATFIENIAVLCQLPLYRQRHDILLRVNSIMATYGFRFLTNVAVKEMTDNERLEAQIVRCLFNEPALLLLGNIDNRIILYGKSKFYRLLKQWQKQGMTILYSTDLIDDALKIADEITVIKQGRWVIDFDSKKKSKKQILDILNDSKKDIRTISHLDSKQNLLVVDNLNYQGERGIDLTNINFTLHGGEVVGIVSLPQNGAYELFAALRGEVATAPAMIKWHGVEPIGGKDVVIRRKKHIGFVPKKPRQQAVVNNLDVFDNILQLMVARPQGQRFGIINKNYIRSVADNIVKKYDLSIYPEHQLLRELSDKDLYKFVLGRELALTPEILILHEPYIGGERGMFNSIHRIADGLVESGGGVIIMSQDVEEVFSICDTVYVLANGSLSQPYKVKEQSTDFIETLMGSYAPHVAQQGQSKNYYSKDNLNNPGLLKK